MRIVDRKTFLQLPIGTLFSEYEPCVFYGLFIKTGHCDEDYFEKELIGNIKYSDSGEFSERLETARLEGTSVGLDFDTEGRNGSFKMGQLYAVYEKQDIVQLIGTLMELVEV